jgi:KDO2-lipid IV(A) lauroyltransferase
MSQHPLKQFRYFCEAAGAWMVFGFFWLLPIDIASSVGGWLGRHVARHLKVTRVARRNLERVMPELSKEKREELIGDMWEHLGRVIGEIPHVACMPSEKFNARVKVEGAEWFNVLKHDGKAGFFISAHFGNWELSGRVVHEHGIPISLVYRKANNPYVEQMIQWIRGHFQKKGIPKGREGAKALIQAIHEGEHIGMLVDQKMNDGIPIPFFGIDAMTAPAVANLALKYKLPIIPTRIVRTKGAHFIYRMYPPILLPETGDKENDAAIIMAEINRQLEHWIRQHPEQWFWVHKRWGN